MKDFIKCFERDQHGAWRCVRPARINLPSGHIEVVPGTVLVKGTRFMNVDLAELLDEEQRKHLRN